MSRTYKAKRRSHWWLGERSRISVFWKHFTKRRYRAKLRSILAQGKYDNLHAKTYQRSDSIWNWD